MTQPARRPTRWEQGGARNRGYGEHFAELIRSGADIDGEARLAAVLTPVAATVLDAGSGMGRVGAALQRRGHRVVGVDLDADLLAQSRRMFPDLPVLRARLDELTPQVLAERSLPVAYDLVVCVGNVMVLLAEGTERTVLARMRDLLAPSGRILMGFSAHGGPPHARDYPVDELDADLASVGLVVEQRFATYDLQPFRPGGDYAVSVLRHA